MIDRQAEAVVVPVFVRLCGDDRDDCRELSFRIPEGISQAELLKNGFAIDGHSAMQSVVSYVNDTTGEYVPISDALRQAQVDLIAWLGAYDLEVEFK